MNILQSLVLLIPNSLAGHQLPTHDKLNVCIIDINGEGPIIAQGAIGEINSHQTPRGKSKVKISLCIIKSYQRTYLEEICSIFDQARSVVSYLKVHTPEKISPQITLVKL